MNLLIQSAMIFFATLMAAGLVALSDPRPAAFDVPARAEQVIHLAANTFRPSAVGAAARMEVRHPR